MWSGKGAILVRTPQGRVLRGRLTRAVSKAVCAWPREITKSMQNHAPALREEWKEGGDFFVRENTMEADNELQ